MARRVRRGEMPAPDDDVAGSQATTNGFRTFHGGWANAAYLAQTSPSAACFQ